MAGNIVHAIASTNATASGLIVLEALKLLSGQPHSCKVRLRKGADCHTVTHQPRSAAAVRPPSLPVPAASLTVTS